MTVNIINLVEKIHQIMDENAYRMATAESCTGGMIAATITDRAGSSSWFDRGFVTYSNQAKIDLLDVKQQTLDEHGAVSINTVEEMALGCLKNSQADYALSVSGIAGPGGGSAEKPVGTVMFAMAKYQKNETVVISFAKHFEGNRQAVRVASVEYALTLLVDYYDTNL